MYKARHIDKQHIDAMRPLVAISPSSGMGNQLFMMAALLGYAERWGYEPVFWEEPRSSWEHQGSLFRVRTMFPTIRVLTAEERQGNWAIIKESANAAFSYNPLPCPSGSNVKLEGYFQSDLYGPSTFPTISSPPSLRASLVAHDWSRTFFLHVRRGDYLHPANARHAVDLREYWRKCLMGYDPSLTCFVVSDDMAWCRKELGVIVGSIGSCGSGGSGGSNDSSGSIALRNREIVWCPEDLSDVETFFWMTACSRGGICANSTFSWWAAWYIHRRVASLASLASVIYMPKEWLLTGSTGSTASDLYPAWAIVL